MGKKQELERQMAECKVSEEYLIGKASDMLTQPAAVKARLWDEIAPYIRAMVETKLKTGNGPENEREFRDMIHDKTMKVLLGQEYHDHLSRV